MDQIIIIMALFFSFSAFSMADYSDDDRPMPTRKTRPKSRIKKLSSRAPQKKSSRRSKVFSDFEVSSNYEAISYGDNKVSKMNMNLHFQTPYNFYIDAEYFTIQSDSLDDNLLDTSYQRGNPKAVLGLQWLEFGKADNKVNLDLLIGLSYKSSSPYSSSSTDQIIGLQTMKRFYNMAIGLNYLIRKTGNPTDESQMSVGNISTFGAEFGYMVSNDIQFSLMAKSISIKKSSNLERSLILDKNISFSYVMPKLTLGIGRFISVELGAIFQTDRVKNTANLLPARLWDLKGLYGNSIFAGLNITI